MTLYEILVQLSQEGSDKIHIDLCDKTIRIGKRKIIEKGEILQHKIIDKEFDDLIDEELDLNELYKQYKYSVPSERDSGAHYFKALSVSQMTDVQLVVGMPRYEARIRLEAYILLASMTGMLKWDNPEQWFWQGKDKDLVILKKYI